MLRPFSLKVSGRVLGSSKLHGNCAQNPRFSRLEITPLRQGFTLVELLVVIAIIGILVSLLLPAIQAARAASQRMSCSNSVKQMNLAVLNYVSARKKFPAGRMGGVNGQWSVHAQILPYIEETATASFVNFAADTGANTTAQQMTIKSFLCPTAPPERLVDLDTTTTQAPAGRSSYRACGGSDTGQAAAGVEKNNGIFMLNRYTTMGQITDGTSKTALFSEVMLGDGSVELSEVPGDTFAIASSNESADQVYQACLPITQSYHTLTGATKQWCQHGRNWTNGNYISTRYNHVMTPNGPSCTRTSGASMVPNNINVSGGAVTASSLHTGGVNLGLADDSVHFVSDSVDVTVWRALGSKNGAEVASIDF
ncbi:MAG: DUF1559 domain-containing protein [Planctomycetota bacterium]|nr:DUF1559 domain-containing protein [Planctomycetota bacterium]